jgi:hypothetical protein
MNFNLNELAGLTIQFLQANCLEFNSFQETHDVLHAISGFSVDEEGEILQHHFDRFFYGDGTPLEESYQWAKSTGEITMPSFDEYCQMAERAKEVFNSIYIDDTPLSEMVDEVDSVYLEVEEMLGISDREWNGTLS